MKPAELFPGAVCAWEGEIYTIVAYDRGLVTLEHSSHTDEQLVIGVECDLIAPLPISPAVLRGLGFVKRGTRAYACGSLSVRGFDDIDGYSVIYNMHTFADGVTYAHALQGACVHLYGIELIWNQNEYEKALKEEQA